MAKDTDFYGGSYYLLGLYLLTLKIKQISFAFFSDEPTKGSVSWKLPNEEETVGVSSAFQHSWTELILHVIIHYEYQ